MLTPNKTIRLTDMWKTICRYVPLLVLLSIAFIIIWQVEKPTPVYKYKRQFVSTSPLLFKKECNPDEERIANYFSVDTLPGLMQKGLIQKYRRNATGTCISVNGTLWKDRSEYFKHGLLKAVFVYNKVKGYELSTKIIDSLSGILYAQISSSAKMEFYN
jgi:hypothetical protein